jgi:hypothetical protein
MYMSDGSAYAGTFPFGGISVGAQLDKDRRFLSYGEFRGNHLDGYGRRVDLKSEGSGTTALWRRGEPTGLPTLASTYKELLDGKGRRADPYLAEWFIEYEEKRRDAEAAQARSDLQIANQMYGLLR